MPLYLWQTLYDAALTEIDPVQLSERIQQARSAMSKRLGTLKPQDADLEKTEYRAILDAQAMLNSLERTMRERL